ncbi:hypothetical protein LIPSTDRAFT_116380 [Lipomyces starkeyi NRRL Y-11557]|uniref:Uncharacterized protein n=1 Tax=Lipomyces starkeyi NRRL Y-11557 TaxID=675824 RepID=A0A1E3QAL0_LIPST|nr:hypothetical protein LIPSTDRAFT_116380 [Lipomyces starkeyi NRRL Y-11557]
MLKKTRVTEETATCSTKQRNKYNLKDKAIRDFMKNYRRHMTKYKKYQKQFTLKFGSKKAPTQSLSVLKKKWNRGECGRIIGYIR